MKKTAYLLIVFLFTLSFSQGQDSTLHLKTVQKPKGTFYMSWGYNRGWYSKSDLHFKNSSGEANPVTKVSDDSYDFVVYDATARDRSGFKDILKTDLTIPQYVYRVGYFFNDKYDLGVEINFDHTKYVVNDNQTLHVKGTIHGQYIDKDTLVDPINFLHFEHTNGANFMMLNIMKRQKLFASKNTNYRLDAIVKLGAGVVIPKTDVTLFGQRVDNRFHIAGYCAGLDLGFRFQTFKYLFLEYSAKGSFENYKNVLVIGSGKANHHFWTFENILVLGLQIPL